MSALHVITKQPKGFFPLFFNEMWDRFSYYGLQSIMVLYLTKTLLFADEPAYALYGVYVTLAFSMPILGGLIADRLTGYRQAITWGFILLIAGNFLLASHAQYFYFGLSLLTCGIGLAKANNASLLGNLYPNDPALKDSGFTLFYMGMNLGAILGPLIYGIITIRYGWHAGFLTSGVGLLISLILFLSNKNYLEKIPKHNLNLFKFKINKNAAFYTLLSLGIISTFLLFLNQTLFQNTILLIIISAFVMMLFITLKAKTIARNQMLILFTLILFSIFYFTCLIQIGSSLTLFIDQNVKLFVFSKRIPTETFASLEPLFVIITAPLLSPLWAYITRKKHALLSFIIRMGIGLLLAGASFAVFSASAKHAASSEKQAAILIVLGNLLLGIGDLAIAPTLISAVTTLAPKTLRGTWMGFWFLSIAFAGYLGSFLAELTDKAAHTAHNQYLYAQAFSEVEKIIIVAFLLFIATSFWLLRLGKRANLINK